ncbi:YkgJ family cysteine cluster protein [Gracilinema caldarium]|uniref:YkgJ family cysteine cluster protein n=1 Tax=Gracilinema caldarium (strain ATCC 51460 / DSM 7334 / H1) TaxID=744872 RepID=F8F4G6_GRAC1|nr:YkgJ family cysteine cluster protein [Gracilinema caldarium]AEJ20613.1 hypothetical protein Spica_2508 [Gracilinema caldarium DSM 7334]
MKAISHYHTPALAETALAEPLRKLYEIYDRIEKSQAGWISATPFRCPEGCGSCCDHFEPDILDVEAYFLASWLLIHQRDRIHSIPFDSDQKGCILSDQNNPYHCTVYEGRPLICRLFAYSGDRGKDGSVRYRPCKFMKSDSVSSHTGKTYSAQELQELFGTLPPVMGDLAGEAAMLLPERSGDRAPLREILPVALAKIQYILDLAAFSAQARQNDPDGNNDGDNDNDGAPLPRAS